MPSGKNALSSGGRGPWGIKRGGRYGSREAAVRGVGMGI